jgi:hypothetical protein
VGLPPMGNLPSSSPQRAERMLQRVCADDDSDALLRVASANVGLLTARWGPQQHNILHVCVVDGRSAVMGTVLGLTQPARWDRRTEHVHGILTHARGALFLQQQDSNSHRTVAVPVASSMRSHATLHGPCPMHTPAMCMGQHALAWRPPLCAHRHHLCMLVCLPGRDHLSIALQAGAVKALNQGRGGDAATPLMLACEKGDVGMVT